MNERAKPMAIRSGSGRRAALGALLLAAGLATGCRPRKPVQTPEPQPHDVTSDLSRVRFFYDDEIAAIRNNQPVPSARTWQFRHDAEVAEIMDLERAPSYTPEFAYLRDKIRIGMTVGQLESSLGAPALVRRSVPPGKGKFGPNDLFTNPKSGPVTEYYYRAKVRLFRPYLDEDYQLDYFITVVVVIQNGRVRTWHEV